MKLSIVICVYNTDISYLDKCLYTLTRSTLAKDGEYEICFVDDGSSTDYSALLAKYSVRYLKTENGGILAARITGAKMATGDYISYVDSDDEVSYDYHLPMLKEAESSGADIVFGDWGVINDRCRYYPKRDDTVCKNLTFKGEGSLKGFLAREGSQHSYYVLWNKIYKRELLLSAIERVERSPIDKRCSYGEDALINFFAFKKAKLVKNVHTGYYFYRIHTSQTVNVTTEDKLERQIKDMSLCLDIMEQNLPEGENKADLKAHIDGWRGLIARSHYSLARGAGYENLYKKIKQAYNQTELRRSTYKDGKAYAGKVILAKNFADIDNTLFSIYAKEKPTAVFIESADGYTRRQIARLKEGGKILLKKRKTEAHTVINAKKEKLLYRLINTAFFVKVGMVFFKKGSKLRNFLKKFL